MSYEENENFEPLVVLQLSSLTPDATKKWIIQRLTANHYEGADLLARFEIDMENNEDIILVGATRNRLLAGAEELRIKKHYKNKGLAEFLISAISHFDNSDLNNFLLKSEKQRIIWEELQSLRPMSNEHVVPGVPTKLITSENDTILSILRSLDFIVHIFPLHDKEDIKLLQYDWFASKSSIFKSQDIHKIRDYFGENVAFYFAFLEFYTKALIPSALLGILLSILPSSDFFKYSFFCVFNVIWWTIFMERWKRLTNRLAYLWGTLDLEVFDRPRSLYYGDLQTSLITNKQERYYPPWKRTLKKYLVSYPIIMVSLFISLTIYFTYCRIQNRTDEKYPLDGSISFIKARVMGLVPSIGYSLLVGPINMAYRELATFLTDFENHRLQTAYENNLTSKLFIFFFVNCFVGLFYEAFFNANHGNVAQMLTSLIIVNAILLKFTDQIIPSISKTFKKQTFTKDQSYDVKSSDVIKQIKTLTPFPGTYGDYLTIFEQYGYVSLFSAVFPWITTCVLINNIFELRADAYKYCRIYQRPFAQPVSNIGSWHYAFDILSSIAIATNTALIAMQPSVREYFASYNDIEYILFFVAAEHILLAIKFAIDFAIPDVPVEVQVERARHLYESNQALRQEREHRAREAEITITKL